MGLNVGIAGAVKSRRVSWLDQALDNFAAALWKHLSDCFAAGVGLLMDLGCPVESDHRGRKR